eukprot:45081_1
MTSYPSVSMNNTEMEGAGDPHATSHPSQSASSASSSFTSTSTSTSTHTRIFGTRLDMILIMGFCSTILFFTLFMICARRWDKYITQKFFAKTHRIYLPQHINSFGSSVRSVMVPV